MLGIPSATDDLADNQTPSTEKAELLETSPQWYDWGRPIGPTPSGDAFHISDRAHKRRSAEFTPPIRVASAADVRDVAVDHVMIKGGNGDLLSGHSRSLAKRNGEFQKSNAPFLYGGSVNVSYVLVSCADARDSMWGPLQSAVKHSAIVEQHTRASDRWHNGPHHRIT